MQEAVTLFRAETGDYFRGDMGSDKWRGEAVEWYRALPASDFAALLAERDALRAEVAALKAALVHAAEDRRAITLRAQLVVIESVTGEWFIYRCGTPSDVTYPTAAEAIDAALAAKEST